MGFKPKVDWIHLAYHNSLFKQSSHLIIISQKLKVQNELSLEKENKQFLLMKN